MNKREAKKVAYEIIMRRIVSEIEYRRTISYPATAVDRQNEERILQGLQELSDELAQRRQPVQVMARHEQQRLTDLEKLAAWQRAAQSMEVSA